MTGATFVVARWEALRMFWQAQDGRCALCGKRLALRSAGLDHCHSNGMARGAVHIGCNVRLSHHERGHQTRGWYERHRERIDAYLAANGRAG